MGAVGLSLAVLASSFLPVLSPVSLRVEVDADSVVVGDPLLVKVTAENRGREEIGFDPPFGTLLANLVLEARPPGGIEYQRVRMLGAAVRSRIGDTGFPVGHRFISYEELFQQRSGAQPLFSTPGRWALRAWIVTKQGRYCSPPVDVQVAVRGDRSAAALQTCLQEVAGAHTRFTYLPSAKELRLLCAFHGDLIGSRAGHVVTKVRLLTAIQGADGSLGKLVPRAGLRKFAESCAPIEREYLALQEIIALLERQEVDTARELFRKLSPPPSTLQRHLELRLSKAP